MTADACEIFDQPIIIQRNNFALTIGIFYALTLTLAEEIHQLIMF